MPSAEMLAFIERRAKRAAIAAEGERAARALETECKALERKAKKLDLRYIGDPIGRFKASVKSALAWPGARRQ